MAGNKEERKEPGHERKERPVPSLDEIKVRLGNAVSEARARKIFKGVCLEEATEAKARRRAATNYLPRSTPLFKDHHAGQRITRDEAVKPKELTESDIGRPVRVVIGGLVEDGVLVGKMGARIKVEFQNGRIMCVPWINVAFSDGEK